MKNPKLIFGLFLAVAALQLFTPISQIWKYEDILRNGHIYKFRTAPVDPYDAFRGKYVALRFANTETTIRKGDNMRSRDSAYVALHHDEKGFAQFGEMTAEPPASGDYLRVEYLYASEFNARFRLPFDSYFMEENLAPKAEQAYRLNSNRLGQTDDLTYVVVRVKNGRGVIENLFIKDQPIREYIKNMPRG